MSEFDPVIQYQAVLNGILRKFVPLYAWFLRKEKRGQDFVNFTSLPAEGRGTE
ncbi:hypothetical protein [Ruegeria sp. A3M17]|uniref:hypothetical protein n=1 Tax=Ruegeria sp. A3M17 TaxID=2267229 RepID=UPI0013145EE5|nr:hypothetical protein [Ruegeria sp. A3M17]